MADGKLYCYYDSFRAYKILIAAKYSGTDLTFVCKSPDFELGKTNKTDDFLQKFPLGKVPAFETKDGKTLFETIAIAHYVSSTTLKGKTPLEQSQVLQWISFADNEILPAAATWVFPCLGIMQYNKQATERAKDDIKKALNILNSHLQSCTFLVGERISLADICVACNMLQLFQWVLEPDFVAAYGNVVRWFDTLIHQPEFETVLGEFKMCQKMAQFDAKKFAEFQGKGDGGKKEKKQKQPQPKKEKKAPKQKEPDPADDDGEPPKKEEKNPFAHLPPGSLNMDEWKRTYSNNETDVALPYLWEHFDAANYSVWYCEYKYPDELRKIFMTCNLVGGMFQRLDKMRKIAFGSMCVFGTDDDNSISGVWIWRGHELAFTLSEDLQIDYESYDWKKLDFKSEETKKLITEYFSWEGGFGGKTFNQGKIFK